MTATHVRTHARKSDVRMPSYLQHAHTHIHTSMHTYTYVGKHIHESLMYAHSHMQQTAFTHTHACARTLALIRVLAMSNGWMPSVSFSEFIITHARAHAHTLPL